MKTVYVSNIDAVGKRGHVRGDLARRVMAISARSLLFTDVMGRPIDSFILPSDPGEAFTDYLRETFGPLPEIKIAPVDPDNLWIADHIDPEWVSGKSVDCFRRFQGPSATVWVNLASSSAKASAGVFHPRVLRGRLFRSLAMWLRSRWEYWLRSEPLGRNWRSSPLVFSLEPRCQV
jgi:hypothetical protein